VPQGRILDVGCSTGAFLFHLQAQSPGCYEATGIDVSGPALDHAESQGVRVLRSSFLETDFGPTPFDAVTFWAVAEHLMDPARFLRRAMELLRPGGRCFVLVPNFRSLAVRLLGQRYRYIFPQHLNYFSARTLGQLAANLPATRVLHTTSMHFNPIVIVQDARSDGRFVPDAERARLLKKTTGYKNNPLLSPVRLAITGVEALLGKCGLADNTVLVLERT
jgi:2-polyprenyl-3-methyl-5-hydroxy-6-metoxy-1,4-benzoquinol methylase